MPQLKQVERIVHQSVFISYKFKRSTLSGGDTYERMVVEALSGFYDIKPHALVTSASTILNYFAVPLMWWRLRKALNADGCGIGIFTADSYLFPVSFAGTSVVIVHHFGSSQNRLYQLCERQVLDRLRRVDHIVVVSDFWRSRLVALGFQNVHLIHNGFVLEDFQVSDDAIEDFKHRYDLVGKPIIYIGNTGSLKGSEKTREALVGLDAHLIASGSSGRISAGVGALTLDRTDYIKLLTAADLVVTMSEFEEGWCRTAHEAMLCGTPVIGSGRGGMRELLVGGHQIVTEDLSVMRQAVLKLLSNQESRLTKGKEAFAYASRFTFSRFRREWLAFVERLWEFEDSLKSRRQAAMTGGTVIGQKGQPLRCVEYLVR